KENLMLGTGLSIFLVMLFARLQMNPITQQRLELLPGAVFYDLVFVGIFIFLSILLLRLIKNNSVKKIFFSFVFILLVFSGIISIINTEIVKFLGTPLNYQ